MFKLKKVQFSYVQNDEHFAVSTCRSFRNSCVTLNISQKNGLFSADLHASEKIVITRLRAVFEYYFSECDRIFLNGYQSWTDSVEHTIHERMRGLDHLPKKVVDKHEFRQYGDYHIVDYPNKAGLLHGFSYGYLRSDDQFQLFGSLSEDSGFTIIRTDAVGNEISFEKDCRGLHLNGDYQGINIMFADGSEQKVFDDYFSALKVAPRESVRPILGYTSWYRHYQGISREIIQNDLVGMTSQDFKSDVFQIDDGYQTAVGDWLSVDLDKFPDGMKEIAQMIREKELLPGIWLAPFVCEEKSELFRLHKDWIVCDSHGNYLKGGSNWSSFYVLDIYNEEVRDYIRTVFDTIIHTWGYGLLKLDFLYAACIQPRPDKTRGQIMADAMKFLRTCAGDAYILGCGVPLASAFGRVDYCRIGCDVSLDWNDKPIMQLTHRERVSTRNTILNTVFRRQLNGRAFLNDPDVFLLRSDHTELTDEQKKMLAEVNALCGSVLFCSDDVSTYEEKQQKLLGKILTMRKAQVQSAEIVGRQLHVYFRLGTKDHHRIYQMG